MLAQADDRCRIRLEEPGDLVHVLGIALPADELAAAVDRIAATGRIEREPGGLRVCVELITRRPYAPIYGWLPKSAVWTASSAEVRLLWITILTISDSTGRLHMPLADLAREAGVEPEAAEVALTWLVDDDRIERSPDGSLQVRRHQQYRALLPRSTPPAEWQPNEQHAALAAELAAGFEVEVDLTAEANLFRRAEHIMRAGRNWDRTFEGWITHAAARRSNENEDREHGSTQKRKRETGGEN